MKYALRYIIRSVNLRSLQRNTAKFLSSSAAADTENAHSS